MQILAVIHRHALDGDTRADARRAIDLNASFRGGGREGVGCLVSNISAAGFMARSYAAIAPGAEVWLRVPGFAALPARVVWADAGRIGCAFDRPLDPVEVERIVRDAPRLH